MGEVICSGDSGFSGGGGWHFDFGGQENQGVGDAFGSCFPNPNAMTPIMFHGGADVPAVNGVRGPCAANAGLLVY
jgi:hypothetical protein